MTTAGAPAPRHSTYILRPPPMSTGPAASAAWVSGGAARVRRKAVRQLRWMDMLHSLGSAARRQSVTNSRESCTNSASQMAVVALRRIVAPLAPLGRLALRPKAEFRHFAGDQEQARRTMTDGVASITAPRARPAYKRILLKISGEALMGPQQFGLHPPTVERIALRGRRAARARRRDRHGDRRRQHLPRPAGQRAGDGAHHGRLHGDARHGDERARDAVGAGGAGRLHPRDLARSRWTRSASPTSAGARCGTSRRAAW